MNITLSNGEKLIQDGKGSYYTSAVTAATGTAYLTSQRFIFNKVSMAKMGLLGAFATFTEGNVPVFDIPLADIQSIKRKKFALTTKYTFVTKGGKEYSIAFASGHEQWITSILDTIKQYTSNTVTEDNEGFQITSPNEKKISSDEALAKLTAAKQKLDLGLITDSEYENIKADLKQYIE